MVRSQLAPQSGLRGDHLQTQSEGRLLPEDGVAAFPRRRAGNQCTGEHGPRQLRNITQGG